MTTSRMLILLSALCAYAVAFPGGAPTESCDSLSPERGHKAPSQPPSTSPFALVQSASHYKPGSVIYVDIKLLDDRAYFKGFIVQAIEKDSGKYIGSFVEAPGLNVMKECSAVTHSNPKAKVAVHLVWVAPKGHSGEVVFRGTIVQTKQLYWEGLFSRVANK